MGLATVIIGIRRQARIICLVSSYSYLNDTTNIGYLG